MDKPKTFEDFIRSAKTSEIRPLTEEEMTQLKLQKLAPEEKIRQAIEWRYQGISVHAISKSFGVTEKQVRKWLKRSAQDYRESLEGTTAADLISEHMMFLDQIENTCLEEANYLKAEGIKSAENRAGIDPRELSDNKKNQIRFLTTALKARETKITLAQDTGIIPKEPERLYHSLEGQKQDSSDSSKPVHSKEEALKDILEQLGSVQRL